MNKTLLILIAGIVVIAGIIGYMVLGGSKNEATHTAGDGHTEAQHAEALPHDDTGTTAHSSEDVPHDDTGTAPHQD
jgi:flagellar basal body-associated protein FliL